MSVLGMLAWFAAAASLWSGARRTVSAGFGAGRVLPPRKHSAARGYRWLAGGAALYCAALIIQRLLGGAPTPVSGLSFADLPSLLGLVAAAVGITILAASRAQAPEPGEEGAEGEGTVSVLPGLADGYVMAVALLGTLWFALPLRQLRR